MTRKYAHDAFFRELRDFLRAAGALVMLAPVHILPHPPDAEQPAKQQGERYIPDLQITHLDDSDKRYLVDVATVDVTAATYRAATSRNPGAAATTAEGRKVREYESKVDGRTSVLIPAAFEMSGRWGEGLISLFKKGVKLATREEKNVVGTLATQWKRRLSITARKAMMIQAHHALRTYLRDDLQDYVEEDTMSHL